MYLNPGSGSFEKRIRSEIYVDKTEMIDYVNSLINTEQRYMSVSRPRRFGKTTAADMLCAYYDRTADSRELFDQLKIGKVPSWDRYLGKFNVIRIVMTDFIKNQGAVEKFLEKMQKRILKDLTRVFPDVELDDEDLSYSLGEVYYETGCAFVIIIDEWDCIFRIRKEDKDGQAFYLNYLRDWLKDKDYIALAYMTGILPIKKYGEHSALNMFDEYSMVAPLQLARFTGFTEEEVKNLCHDYKMNYEDIKNWYDGYLVSDRIPVSKRRQYHLGEYSENIYSIYSPLSVINAMRSGYIMNYWNNTESYEALAEYIRRDYDGLQSTVALLMDGGSVKVNLSSYQNDMTTFHSKDDVLALLIHLGYLSYDIRTGEVFIPNKEILDVFKTSTKTDM